MDKKLEDILDELYSLAWQDGREGLNRREKLNIKFSSELKSYAKDYALSLLPEERGGYSPGIRKYTNKTFNECIKQIKDKIK